MESQQQELMETDRQFAQMSLEKGAAEAFHHFLVENALELSPHQHPVIGRAKISTSLRSGDHPYTLSWEPQRAEVAGSGEMGWTWGTYVLRVQQPGAEVKVSHGKYLNIWTRQEHGQWRVAVDMGNPSPGPFEKL